MNFEILHISRGDIRLRSENKIVRVLGEALAASLPTEPSYVIYLNSIKNWEVPADMALSENERSAIISAIRKHFNERGSVVEFE